MRSYNELIKMLIKGAGGKDWILAAEEVLNSGVLNSKQEEALISKIEEEKAKLAHGESAV